MTEASWREDLRKLEGEIEGLAANLDVDQRKTGAAKLREELKREGKALSSADEELIQGFVDGKCSIDDLALHFHGRFS